MPRRFAAPISAKAVTENHQEIPPLPADSKEA
jgi:hypothetical protein